MNQLVYFNKSGYEPFIDYIKAFAIICVLIGHTSPWHDEIGYGLWAGLQVPLFVLVQSFHSLKKPVDKLNWVKLFWRILVPYCVVQVVIFLLFGIRNGFNNSLIVKFIYGGGYGPGSYFPWIYLQIAVVLKFVRPMFDKGSKIKQTIFAVCICEALEVLCSLVNLPDWIYRLLAIRYFFLIFLAWIWVKDGIQMTKTKLVLSLLSAASIVFFEYFASDTEPLFFNTAWEFHRWPCYFYVAFLLTYLLFLLYTFIRKSTLIDRFVKMLAKCSYEIFLVQMAACMFVPTLFDLSNQVAAFVLRILFVFIISILGGYAFNLLLKRLNIISK